MVPLLAEVQAQVRRGAPAPCMKQLLLRLDPVATAASISAAVRRFSCAGAARRFCPSTTSSCCALQFALLGGSTHVEWRALCPTRHASVSLSTWSAGAGQTLGREIPRRRNHQNEMLLSHNRLSSPSRTAARRRSSRRHPPLCRAAISARAQCPIADACWRKWRARSSAGADVLGGRRAHLWCWLTTTRPFCRSRPRAAGLPTAPSFAVGAYRAPASHRLAVRRTRALVLPLTASAILTDA